jgi:MYXO-CTERM domain-containing protein
VKRRIAAIALAVLAITAAPPAAFAPAPPAPAWDWFTIEALLRAASDGEPASLFADRAPLRAARAPTVTPEPTAAVLAAFGLAALALGRRRSLAPQ